jgi:ribosomal protein S27E
MPSVSLRKKQHSPPEFYAVPGWKTFGTGTKDGAGSLGAHSNHNQGNEGEAMKINCISCGHKFDLGDAYDEYEGQVKCYICGNILEIQTHEGNVKSARVIKETAQMAELTAN